MYTIRTLNNIAKTGLAKLPEQNFVIDEKAENPEGIILRSFDMHKMELNESLLAVARAGAGTNNIPIEKCTQKGVPVFNTPGANANAVKELVLAGLFASSRRIIAGAAWVQGLKDNCESVEKAVEYDPVIANTYQRNHPEVDVIVDDIKNIDTSDMFAGTTADVIIGGPPCQGFSMAGARIRQGFIDDPRNYLFKHYFNVVKTVRPKVFVMENVKGISTMQGGKIFEEIKRIFQDPEALNGKPYHIYHRVINAADFGVPQRRERMIIIGTLVDEVDIDTLWEKTLNEIKSEYPTYFDEVTVLDAIGNLSMTSEDGVIDNPSPETDYEKYLSCDAKTLTNHSRSRHSKVAVERMSKIKNGENYTALNEQINSVHSGSYGRLCWNEQASTITTRFDTPAGGRFIHPDEDRTLTPREAARIQSFPDSYVFYGDKRSISRQIGNAVPPKVSYFLARLVRNILDVENSENIGD